MTRVDVLGGLMAAAGLATLAAGPAAAQDQTWRFHADHVLGSSFDMAVAARTEAEAEFAFAAAFAEIARLDRALSGWRDDSELSALNRASAFTASDDLFRVIAACEAWRERTGGAFCARLGDVENTWRGAQTTPDAAVLKALAAAASSGRVALEPSTRRIERPAGTVFAVDGLAKGYVIDAAIAQARRAAPCASGLMIEIGGDLRCWGVDGRAKPWAVGVAAPGALHDNAAPAMVLRVADRAVAASGPGLRDRTIAGREHGHLLDPASGWTARPHHAVVVAERAADADALATALSVMKPRAGLRLAESLPGVEAAIFTRGRRMTTTGWAALEAAKASQPAWAVPASCAAGSGFPPGFVVEVAYELPKFEVANYRKPYVVAWVTDAAKTPVRMLLVSGDKLKWMENNYVWWRRIGRKDTAPVEAMAKPTRAPGRYSVVWDGKDDAGRPAPQGRYTIHIEAAREHGGHAYQAIDIDLGAQPAQASGEAKDELAAASVRYGKRK